MPNFVLLFQYFYNLFVSKFSLYSVYDFNRCDVPLNSLPNSFLYKTKSQSKTTSLNFIVLQTHHKTQTTNRILILTGYTTYKNTKNSTHYNTKHRYTLKLQNSHCEYLIIINIW